MYSSVYVYVSLCIRVYCMCVYHCPDVFACTICLCMFMYHCPDVFAVYTMSVYVYVSLS